MITASNNVSSSIVVTEQLAEVAKKEPFLRLVQVTQFFVWPILFLIFNLFFNIKINGNTNLKTLKNPFIIISNHVAFYDSFILRLALGFLTPHLPLRFMAVKHFNSYYLNLLSKFGIINLIYYIFGVFTVVPGQGMVNNLSKALNIIRNGGNIVMYPEGQITADDKISTFRLGTAILAKETNTPVLPFSFRFGNRMIFRRNLFINIGQPIYPSNISPEELTEMYYSAVLFLHSKSGS